MEGTVVTGFGRGSRKLGVPTANMDPVPLQQQLQQLPRGVYFGWAQLDAPGEWPAADSAVHKMVMNVGRRPTVNTGKGLRCAAAAVAAVMCLAMDSCAD
jgi:riboflavin kinase